MAPARPLRSHIRRTALIMSTAPKTLVSNNRRIGVVRFLNSGAVPVTGIVDQHVDAPEARPPGLLYHRGDLCPRSVTSSGSPAPSRGKRPRCPAARRRFVCDDGVIGRGRALPARSARPSPVEHPVMSHVAMRIFLSWFRNRSWIPAVTGRQGEESGVLLKQGTAQSAHAAVTVGTGNGSASRAWVKPSTVGRSHPATSGYRTPQNRRSSWATSLLSSEPGRSARQSPAASVRAKRLCWRT